MRKRKIFDDDRINMEQLTIRKYNPVDTDVWKAFVDASQNGILYRTLYTIHKNI